MNRVIVPLIAGLALVALLLVGASGGFGATRAKQYGVAQPPPPGQTQMSQDANAPAHPLPPELEFLRTMSAEQQFDSVTGAQVTFTNPQGQQVALRAIPGTVSSVAADSLTITPNGQTTTQTFSVTQSTMVRGMPRSGSLFVFAPGDRVVVVVVDNSTSATAIVEPRLAMMMMGYRHMRGYEAGGPQMMATPPPGATPATPSP